MKMKKMTKKEYDAFRKKETERKRAWRARKRLEKLEKTKPHPSLRSGVRRVKPRLVRPTKSEQQVVRDMMPKEKPKVKRHIRFRRRPIKPEKVVTKFKELVPEALPVDNPDVVEEQLELPLTTLWCPQSIGADGLGDVRKNPEMYIETNMVKKSRVVDTFYIKAECKKFFYKKLGYSVKEDAIYLLPTRLGPFMPTIYFKEGDTNPKGFKQMNKGITGKALSLLYMEQLYTSLLYSEDVKYNFFIVILSIAILIAFGIGNYFLFFGGAMAPHAPSNGVPVTMTILGRWMF